MGWLNALVLIAVVAGQGAQSSAPSQSEQLPPPYPRPGTTKLLENDIVAVWDVAWLKQQYPLHTHRYDLVGISYAEGDRIITQGNAPGRLVNTKPWVFQTNRAGVTHVEEGASDSPMRAVQIELKKAAPGAPLPELPDGLRHVLGAASFENNRAVAWALAPGAQAPMHRHVGDAVEMVFTGTPPAPKIAFVPAGTAHAGPSPGEGGRVYIFEIK
jgi:hypothetical protein